MVFAIDSLLQIINNNSRILTKLKLESGKYFLISCHREENVDNEKNFKLLIESLNELANKYKMSIVFPIHPRTKKEFFFEAKRPDDFDILIKSLKKASV